VYVAEFHQHVQVVVDLVDAVEVDFYGVVLPGQVNASGAVPKTPIKIIIIIISSSIKPSAASHMRSNAANVFFAEDVLGHLRIVGAAHEVHAQGVLEAVKEGHVADASAYAPGARMAGLAEDAVIV
jgi:hypothetical protein